MSGFKTMLSGRKAREEILEGVETLASAVSSTMGPRGKNVIIEQPGGPPHLTKDGVTVAKCINLRDKYKNLGVQVVKEAASRTADTAGDGTTTATVLCHAIYSEGLKMINSSFQPSEIVKGINDAKDVIIEELQTMARPLECDEEIIQVGTISANGDREIGELIARAMSEVGRDGTLSVEEAKGFQTTLDIVNGTQIDRGFVSPYFVTDQTKMTCVLDRPYVLLYGSKLTSIQDILGLLEEVRKAQRPLLIIADDIDGDALQGLVVNKLKGVLDVCAIRSPEFGTTRISTMEDLEILTGGTFISEVEELKEQSISALGTCRRIIVGKNVTTLVGASGEDDKIQDRVSAIKEYCEDPSLDVEDINAAKRRIARLANGVAVIRVGGSTEIEMKERKDRIDDALSATRAAVAEGILPGGGTALVRASKRLSSEIRGNVTDRQVGIRVLANACQAPLRQIVTNLGKSPELVVEKVSKLKGANGFDARQEKYIDLLDAGVIDPLVVVRCALENSVSAACSLLSIGVAIVEDDSEDQVKKALSDL